MLRRFFILFLLSLIFPFLISAEDHSNDSTALENALGTFLTLPQSIQEEVLDECLDCKLLNGPAGSPAEQCDGTCPNQGDVCTPAIGTPVRRVTPGKGCECVPEPESKCDYSETTRNGKKKYRWAEANACHYGACPAGQTCKSGTQTNGDPLCECS